MKKITWVLAHEPYNIFIKAATHFSNRINEETNGKYQIEVLTLSQYNKKNNLSLTAHSIDRIKIIDRVNSGSIDMATVYVNSLGKLHNDLYALGMPFLFRDHEHSEKVLDGVIGKELLNDLSKKTNLKGMAFTYSGGFRIVPSKKIIEKVDDFKNLNIRCGLSPVAVDTFLSVGSNPKQILIDDFFSEFNLNNVEAGETTYPRFFSLRHNESSKFINHTEHSLFLTGIILNSRVWNNLDKSTKILFENVAIEAARIERLESLSEIELVQKRAKSDGIETIIMSEIEKDKFKKLTSTLYTKYETIFKSGLLTSIKKQQ